jgi:hypothetical protein
MWEPTELQKISGSESFLLIILWRVFSEELNASDYFGPVYIKYFRNELPVTTAVRVEKGHHGEYGWGVYFEQGRHRCVLAGTVANRPEEEAWEDTLWTACAEWANFAPVLGKPKIHREALWAPDEFGHIFAGDTFESEYAAASEHRRALMDKFAAGTWKFAQVYEFLSASEEDPPKRADGYAYHAAASRRIRISDGPSLWEEGQVVFAPPSSQPVAGTSPQFDFSTLGATSSWRARRGQNRIKRFRAGLGPGQCSHLFWRILAETFTTHRLIQPMVGAGT